MTANHYDSTARHFDDERPLYHRNRSWVSGDSRPAPTRRFSNMADPRRMNRDEPANISHMGRQEKRHASRSPDGPRPPKQSRQDRVDGDASRRSSTSNSSTPHHVPREDSPHNHNRRASLHNGVVQAGKDAKSPNHRPGGLSSGRSTPKQHQGVSNEEASRPVKATSTTAAQPISGDIVAALSKFMLQAGKLATLQYQKEEADARFQRAEAAYKANQAHFTAFPALRDRKTRPRIAAQEELRAVSKKLEEHQNQQQIQIGMLADLITPIQQPMLAKEDFVSVEAFQALKSSFDKLQKESGEFKGKVGGNKIELDTVRKAQQDSSHRLTKVEELTQDLKSHEEQTMLWRSTTDEKLAEIQSSVKHDKEKMERDVEMLVSWKQGAQPTVERADESMKKIQIVEHNLGSLFEFKTAVKSDMDSTRKDLDQTCTQLGQELSDVSKHVAELRAAKPAVSTQDLEEQVSAALSKVGIDGPTKQEHVVLEGRQDFFDQRLAKVEKFVRKSPTRLLSESAPPTNDTSPGTFADFTSLSTELQVVKGDVDYLETEQKKVQEVILAHVNEEVGKIQAEMHKVQHAPQLDPTSMTRLDNAMAAMDARVTSLAASVEDKANVNVVGPMKGDLDLVVQKQDQLCAVFDQLKRRYDNLTTDEVTKAMLNQLSAVWPNGMNANRIEQLAQSFNHHTGLLRRIEGDLEKVKADVVKNGAVGAGPPEHMQELQKTVDGFAHSISKHQTLLDKLNVDEVLGEIKRLSETVRMPDKQMSNVDDVAMEIVRMQSTMASMTKALGELTGKVNSLEAEVVKP